MPNNPYVISDARLKSSVKLTAVASAPLDLVDRVTGDVMQVKPYFGTRSYRDVSEFIKVYDPIAIALMKPFELKVFMYGILKLDYEGGFDLVVDECMKMMNMCESSVKKGIRGLLAIDAVRREKKGKYWINPNIAYRGNREELFNNL